MAHQVEPIGLIRGEAAALVGLAVGSPQDLFVGGEHLHTPTGVNGALHARRAELIAPLQPGLHQSPLLLQQGEPALGGHRQVLQFLAQPLATAGC